MSKPVNWPDNVIYVARNVYSQSLGSDILKSLGCDTNKTSVPQRPISHVKIKKIDESSHPAFGQFGLFANAKLAPKSYVIDYLGYVHNEDESDKNSDYDINLDRQLGIAIDARKYGCEARMVNDYRGIMDKPNVEFENRIVNGELRMAIFVGSKPIAKGQELCINYGKGFWKARND